MKRDERLPKLLYGKKDTGAAAETTDIAQPRTLARQEPVQTRTYEIGGIYNNVTKDSHRDEDTS